MTESGQFEIWFCGDINRSRHIVGRYPSKPEADKAWKRLFMFARAGEEAKHELLEPSVQQQLANKEREIAAKGQAQPPAPRKTFEQILMAKVDQKRKRYVELEKIERQKPHLDLNDEKQQIQGGIKALRWAHAEYMNANQMELVK